MVSYSSISTLLVLLTSLQSARTWTPNTLSNYFEGAQKNVYQLNVLPEYKIERYVFPDVLTTFEADLKDEINDVEGTIIYRMSEGPKSPKAEGKKPVLFQHGILCDSDPCVVNKPQIAIAYILVDQGYDIWLGVSNSSLAENMTSSEEVEKRKLERVAKYILATTKANELSVMGQFNGTVRIFAISSPFVANNKEHQSKISKWLEYIPGVKMAKKLYQKGKDYFAKGYDKVIEGIDIIGKKIDYIMDDSTVRDLKKTVLKSWGFVTKMVVPTLGVDDFSQMIDHPDVNLDTPQLIRKYGYHPESHEVKTDDGYLLTLHRICGKSENPVCQDKPVVFLQHGILSSSSDWVVMGPSNGLGYLLADAGYDVWMGNSRGNTYSKGHVNLSTSDIKFWDFSWHEMGVFDLPATIDYILKITGKEKIFYTGHSQGCTSLLVLLSEKPEYNDKIIKAAAYAPIAFTSHMRSPIIIFFSKISTPLYYMLRFLHVYEFLPTNALLTNIGRDACEARSLYQVVCSNTLFMITGYDTDQLNKTMVPIIIGHVPAGSSIKQFFHFAQEFKSGRFCQFDYIMPFLNEQKYGQSKPPDYNLQNVKVPIAIFYADNDLLADYRDIEKLAAILPSVQLYYKIPNENFNHIDFMFAIDSPKLIYEPTIKFFRTAKH
ncbi:lipase 3-like isoform X2 [Belonocnema kinseyi]|uniref:lipase 3-like isoform X2 n=1 Tax=Belonocnema kinseyi TaxID=2817044 RepID=UPI00143CFC10|nr:lipase 3-like isoform X2 [Belonocnema kinseyi]